MDQQDDGHQPFNAAEIGVMAHLYRAEIYRSTIWRTRLDTTTNWAVVTLGVALSITYSSPQASPLPLVLVGILIIFFLMIEARRYRYFNVWRARCRWLELNFVSPLLGRGHVAADPGWRDRLAQDYRRPAYHVGMRTAIGRRVRRSYFWILLIQALAYLGKLIVHPTPLNSLDELLTRARIGPLPGGLVLTLGALYCLTFGLTAWWSLRTDRKHARRRHDPLGMG